jgi:hypothetical protein
MENGTATNGERNKDKWRTEQGQMEEKPRTNDYVRIPFSVRPYYVNPCSVRPYSVNSNYSTASTLGPS